MNGASSRFRGMILPYRIVAAPAVSCPAEVSDRDFRRREGGDTY